jgi:hypothetical protein
MTHLDVYDGGVRLQQLTQVVADVLLQGGVQAAAVQATVLSLSVPYACCCCRQQMHVAAKSLQWHHQSLHMGHGYSYCHMLQ